MRTIAGVTSAKAYKGWLKRYARAVKAQSVSIAQIIGSVIAVAVSLSLIYLTLALMQP